jgi:hypothetical protein
MDRPTVDVSGRGKGEACTWIAEGLRHLAVPIDTLKPDASNARRHGQRNMDAIKASLARWGQRAPIVVQRSGMIVRAGNGRLEAAKALGWSHVAAVVVDDDSVEAVAFALADNRTAELAEWDTETLATLLDTLPKDVAIDTGFTDADLASMLSDLTPSTGSMTGSLAARFVAPPMTVLNARDGWWRDRKRAWLDAGVASESGRDDQLVYKSMHARVPDYYNQKNSVQAVLGRTLTDEEFQKRYLTVGPGAYTKGTSIFDPVLCELLYRWFCPPSGVTLDPFAGGSVRGIVGGKLGRRYVGVDLRPEQIEANRKQAATIFGDGSDASSQAKPDQVAPEWRVGDSRNIDTIASDVTADFVLSCPPYADLEVYSDDPADLSTMEYDDFRDAYRVIIAKTCARLRQNRFAAFVVGEVRDKRGHYHDFVGDTVQAFRDAGLHFYNEAILVTPVGSAAMQASSNFHKGRKLVKTHQNVLVFVKGDGKIATQECGEVDVTDVLPDDTEATT